MKKFQNDKNIYEEISEWFIVDYNIFTFCNTWSFYFAMSKINLFTDWTSSNSLFEN